MNPAITSRTSKPMLQQYRRKLLIGGPLLLLLVIGVLYLIGGRMVSTDDAYVDAARTQISANVAGRVIAVNVKDNQAVHQGDILFKLDDRPFAIAIEDAKAHLASARLQISAMKATYLQHQADVKAAKDTLDYQTREFKRQQTLSAKGISSKAQLDQAQHTFETAQQQVVAVEQQLENLRASLGGDPDIAVDEHPTVQAAKAALDRAELDLSYATIEAPADGIVTKVEQLQVGDYINASTPVFALVSDSDIWVEANFKETELTYMHPGQHADIEIDTYPGHRFTGTVASTSPGTGSSFSLLPPENASGNWVKVVQRLPVRIHIDTTGNDVQLHAGLSATVTVDTEARRYERIGK